MYLNNKLVREQALIQVTMSVAEAIALLDYLRNPFEHGDSVAVERLEEILVEVLEPNAAR